VSNPTGLLSYRGVFNPVPSVAAHRNPEHMNTARLHSALRDLDEHWTAGSGPVYLFRYEGQWVAKHVRTGQELTAASAEELRVTVADDYAQREADEHP
jgi:hypothetical protein